MGTLRFIRANLRWLAFGFLLSFVSSVGQTFFISLFSEQIRDTYALGHGGFGSVYSIATLISGTAMLLFGRFADGRHFERLLVVSFVGLAGAAFFLPSAHGLLGLGAVILLLRFFGQGMMGHLCFTTMGRWFDAERGRAIAIAALGFTGGQAALPWAAVRYTESAGWNATWSLVAIATLSCLPIAWWLLGRGRTPRAGTEGESSAASVHPSGRDWTQAQVLRDPLFYALVPGAVAPGFVMTGVFFHQAHLVEVKGWALSAFGSWFTLYSAAGVGASLLSGWAVDRWSAHRMIPYFLLPMTAALVVLGMGEGNWAGASFMLLAGLTAGAGGTLGGALWPELYGTRHLGAVRSLAFAVVVLATGIAPVLMGVLLDAGIGIEAQVRSLGAYSGVSALSLFVLRGVTRRRAEGG